MFWLQNKNVPRPDRIKPTLFRAGTVPETVRSGTIFNGMQVNSYPAINTTLIVASVIRV